MFSEKIKWIAGLLVVFFLVLATNLVDRSNFNRIKNSVISIYKDRLVAKGIIFDMNALVNQKQVALLKGDTTFFKSDVNNVNEKINTLYTAFCKTKITREENLILNNFSKKFEQLEKLELANKQTEEEYLNVLIETKKRLSSLGQVQLDEGKREWLSINRNINSIEFFTQLEVIFLIITGILVQIIILYRPKSIKDEFEE